MVWTAQIKDVNKEAVQTLGNNLKPSMEKKQDNGLRFNRCIK